jgi:hypothetical protein
MKALCLSVALALFAAVPLFAQAPPHNDRQILPGKRVGLVSLDEPISNVEQDLGGPRARQTSDNKQWISWPADKHGGLISVVSRKPGDFGPRVGTIRVTSKKYFTPSGIYVGMGVERIQLIYSSAKVSPIGSTGKTLYDDVADGVAFEVSQGNELSPAHCTAIYVHKAGKALSTDEVEF